MGRRQGHMAAGNDKGKAFGVVARCLDADVRAFDSANPGAFRPLADCAMEVGERKITLVVGP